MQEMVEALKEKHPAPGLLRHGGSERETLLRTAHRYVPVVAQCKQDTDERESMNSGDNQKMIIRKDVQFAVDWNSAETDKQR